MQNPNPGYGGPAAPGYPPQKTGPPWGWILGIGCGGCALVVLIATGMFFMFARSVVKDIENAGTPPEYYGEWQAQDNSVLSIHADKTGEFKGGSVSVVGPATLDSKT